MVRPTVSVILPVRGDEPRLDDALDSLLAQSFRDFEVILVVETPSDSTAEFVSKVRDRDAIRIEGVPDDTGLSESLNRGIELARGEFVARQDADDASRSDRFEAQVSYLRAHPEVALLGTAATIEGPDGGTRTYDPPTEDVVLRWESLWTNPFVHTSVMVRRDVLESHDLAYRAGDPFATAEDYDLWVRIMRRAEVATLAEPLVTYREREESLSQQHAERQTRNFTTLARRTIAERANADLSREQVESIRATLYTGRGSGASTHRERCEATRIYLDVLANCDWATGSVRELAAKRALDAMIPPRSASLIPDYLRPFRVCPWLPVAILEELVR